jgi:hypothetical protein
MYNFRLIGAHANLQKPSIYNHFRPPKSYILYHTSYILNQKNQIITSSCIHDL